jgi:hypothetical protein
MHVALSVHVPGKADIMKNRLAHCCIRGRYTTLTNHYFCAHGVNLFIIHSQRKIYFLMVCHGVKTLKRLF